MKYMNAKQLLPEALVTELQTYIQSGYLYIPAASGRQPWGALSGCREALRRRNKKIVEEYTSGQSIAALADRYFLSVSAIRKIVYAK